MHSAQPVEPAFGPTNEDSIGSFAPSDPLALERKGYLYVVADGLGGHNAGEVASSSAVARLGEEYCSPSSPTRIEAALRQAVQAANLRIHELTHRHAEYRSMETTLSAVAIAGPQAYIAHIGDSRVYQWRASLAPGISMKLRVRAVRVQSRRL